MSWFVFIWNLVVYVLRHMDFLCMVETYILVLWSIWSIFTLLCTRYIHSQSSTYFDMSLIFPCLSSFLTFRSCSPSMCYFCIPCLLIICTHLGGAILTLWELVAIFGLRLILLQILVLSSNTKKGEIERTVLTPRCFVC